MSNSPFFSIVIPTYNRADLIAVAIKSVLGQTFQDFEIIVVDDGSTDDTEEVVNRIDDKRLRYFKKKNEERSIARNFGIKKAKGTYIGFLDADDYYLTKHLEKTYNYINTFQNVNILHTGYEYRNEKDEIISSFIDFSDNFNKNPFLNNPLICNSMIIKKELLETNRFIQNKYAIFAEDWYLWILLASQYKFHFLEEVTTVVIQHSNRSLNQLSPLKIKKSIDLVIDMLSNESCVSKKYDKKELNNFAAQRYLFVSYTALSQKQYIIFIECLIKVLFYNPNLFFKSFLTKFKKGLK